MTRYRVWLRIPGMTGWSCIARGLDAVQAKAYAETLLFDHNIEPEEN